MTTTEDVAGFLLARIAWDEADLRAGADLPDERWTTERLLADCEAKRAIVKLVLELDESSDAVDTIVLGYGVADELLGLLALPYADHPDYRKEWKS